MKPSRLGVTPARRTGGRVCGSFSVQAGHSLRRPGALPCRKSTPVRLPGPRGSPTQPRPPPESRRERPSPCTLTRGAPRPGRAGPTPGGALDVQGLVCLKQGVRSCPELSVQPWLSSSL